MVVHSAQKGQLGNSRGLPIAIKHRKRVDEVVFGDAFVRTRLTDHVNEFFKL